MKTEVKEVKNVQKVNELNVIEVKTRLDQETAQKAVTNEQKKQLKTETVESMVKDFKKSIEPLKDRKFGIKELKTKFNKDFNKNESEYKGIFALFNALAKGKSNNAVNDRFYKNNLDKKFKFGKEYSGILLLGCMKSSDLMSQLNNPQKFSTSQAKHAFKVFNTYVTSFERFEEVLKRASVINELIKAYKGGEKFEGKQLTEFQFIEALNGLQYYENLKDGLTNGLSEAAKKKVCSRVYSL